MQTAIDLLEISEDIDPLFAHNQIISLVQN